MFVFRSHSNLRKSLETTLGDNLVFVRMLLSSDAMCHVMASWSWIGLLLGIAGQLNSDGKLDFVFFFALLQA